MCATRVIAFNGSGRKNWNTAKLAKSFLEGAKSVGATTELVHLGDLKFRGCQGCLSCQRVGTKQDGHCVQKDDLTKYIDNPAKYDVICFATPILMMADSSMMRALIERMIFPIESYNPNAHKFHGHTQIAYIRTGNITDEFYKQLGQNQGGIGWEPTVAAAQAHFGNCEKLIATETLQCNNYKKYNITMFDEQERKKRNKEHFPVLLKQAFDLGVKLVERARKAKASQGQ